MSKSRTKFPNKIAKFETKFPKFSPKIAPIFAPKFSQKFPVLSWQVEKSSPKISPDFSGDFRFLIDFQIKFHQEFHEHTSAGLAALTSRVVCKVSSRGSRGFRGSCDVQCEKRTTPFLNNPLPALVAMLLRFEGFRSDCKSHASKMRIRPCNSD